MSDKKRIEDFQRIENAFNEAVVSNNVEKIESCISTDWVLIDKQGGIIPRDGFLQAVKSGILSHATMTKEILRVKVYGDMALVTGRGKNTGMFKGNPIKADEWVTDVYQKQNDNWICVLTHLTPVT